MAQIERETASNLLLDVLALSSQQGRALHAELSVFTQSLAYVASDLSVPQGGIIGRRARSHSTLSRVVAASPAPEYLLLYISILRQQSCPKRHLKVDKKNEVSSQRFLSGHMFLNHFVLAGNRRETCSSCEQRSASEMFRITAEPVILYVINIPAVVLLQILSLLQLIGT